jgi:hypothetical protein
MEQLRRVVQGWLEIALAPVAWGLVCLGASANDDRLSGLGDECAVLIVRFADRIIGGAVYSAAK